LEDYRSRLHGAEPKKILFDLPDLVFVTGLPDKVANAYRQLMDVWQPGESRVFVWV